MSQNQLPGADAPRRHPSAGNLGARPALVPPGSGAPDLPTVVTPAEAREVRLAPDLVDEAAQRLVGNVEAKRVLDLGCGDGANAIAMARQGAKVIAVDTSAERLAAARRAAEEAEVRIEFHHGDLADLPFVRADQIDLALAAGSLARVHDIARVFRQVHRVLRTEAPFVIALPHPLTWMVGPATKSAPKLVRSAFDTDPVASPDGPVVAHRLTDVVTELVRSNFRPDALLEPRSSSADPRAAWIPTVAVVRGRKQGI